MHRLLAAVLVALATVACSGGVAVPDGADRDGPPDADDVGDLTRFAGEVCDTLEEAYTPLFVRWSELEAGFNEALVASGLHPDGPPMDASEAEVEVYFQTYAQLAEPFEEQAAQLTADAARDLPAALRGVDPTPAYPDLEDRLARAVEVDALLGGISVEGAAPLDPSELDVTGAPRFAFDRLGDDVLADALNTSAACARISETQLDGAALFSSERGGP